MNKVIVSGTTFRRIRHAAHYAPAHPKVGHDLEEWTVPSNTTTPAEARTFAGADLPRDAEYHHGFRSPDGIQHWVFVRIASLSPGRCERCPVSP